jgi:SAM-dependent methyltransferase
MDSSHPIDYDGIAQLYDAYVTVAFDVPFFTAECRSATGPVLELMAGTGRLSLPLVEAGADLTCVDRAAGMLAVLAKKLDDRGLRAEIHCCDVCSLRLPPRFGLAILPLNSFTEIVGDGRQRAALSAVFASLLPGGRFICTLHNPAVRRAEVDGTVRVMGRFPFEDGSLVVSASEHGGQPVVSRLQFFEYFRADGSLAWSRLLPMEFELIERRAFEGMAVGAGFRPAELYGSWERVPFDPVASSQMIWVLEKPMTQGP